MSQVTVPGVAGELRTEGEIKRFLRKSACGSGPFCSTTYKVDFIGDLEMRCGRLGGGGVEG